MRVAGMMARGARIQVIWNASDRTLYVAFLIEGDVEVNGKEL